MEYPLVTIIVPSYNHEKFIKECIESIINQTYKNCRLIVIDDGSIDNTPKILMDLQLKYGFELQLQNNFGISYTLNKAIEEFSFGKYITLCASDDFWLPDKIEKQVNFMEANYFYPMCFGKTYYVDSYSNIITELDSHNHGLREGSLFDDILTFQLHPPVNYMFRTKIFKEVGLYDKNILAEDYYMNLKIARKYNIGFLNEYLGFYRYNASANKVERFDIISDSHLKVIDCYKDHYLYTKAKNLVFLRKFDTFSGFTQHKIKALKNFPKALLLIHDKRFWIGILKFFFYWKR